MSRRKIEPGERMTEAQEDYCAGRLQWQKKVALQAKEIRTFIIKNPGCNDHQIKEGTGITKIGAAINWLTKRRLIKYTTFGWEHIPL